MIGAKYWIPTLDEQIKVFHYDPHRYGPGIGGYWLNMNRRDETGIPGEPGVGQTSAGWTDPDRPLIEFDVPLGAYPASYPRGAFMTQVVELWNGRNSWHLG